MDERQAELLAALRAEFTAETVWALDSRRSPSVGPELARVLAGGEGPSAASPLAWLLGARFSVGEHGERKERPQAYQVALGEVEFEGDGPLAEALRGNQRGAGVAQVIPIMGPIVQRESVLTRYYGFTSSEAVARVAQQAAADPNVKVIVFDVDSPGGTVSGAEEAASALFALRGQKAMVAVANSLMASCAYYLGSAAHEVVASPSSEVGSIGVWNLHYDWTGAFEQMGIKPTLFRAGRFKFMNNPYEPLSEEAAARMQRGVDEYYDQFVKAVARHRGVTPAQVRAGYGEGDVLTAQRAVTAGLADRVATMQATLARFGAGVPAPASKAEDTRPPAWAVERERVELELAIA